MLAGDLGDFPLPDILRLLSATEKSGRLEVAAGDDRGRIELVDGRLTDASPQAQRHRLARRLVGAGSLDADAVTAAFDGPEAPSTDRSVAERLVERDALDPDTGAGLLREHVIDALFELLGWTEGAFRFDAADLTEARWSWTVDEVLVDAGSRLEGWDGLLARTGAGADVVTVQAAADRAVTIGAPGWQLLGLADGHRTVDDLAELSGRGRFDTRRILAELLDVEVVEIVPASQGATVARLLAAHAALDRVEGARVPDPDAVPPPGAVPEAAPVTSDETPDTTDTPAEPTAGSAAEPTAAAETAGTSTAAPSDPAAAAAELATSPDEPTPWTSRSDDGRSESSSSEEVPATTSMAADPADGEAQPGRTLPPADRPARQPPVDEDLLEDLVAGIEAMR